MPGRLACVDPAGGSRRRTDVHRLEWWVGLAEGRVNRDACGQLDGKVADPRLQTGTHLDAIRTRDEPGATTLRGLIDAHAKRQRALEAVFGEAPGARLVEIEKRCPGVLHVGN